MIPTSKPSVSGYYSLHFVRIATIVKKQNKNMPLFKYDHLKMLLNEEHAEVT